MGAMVTVLVTAAGLAVLGVREIQEMHGRRAMRRRIQRVMAGPTSRDRSAPEMLW